MAYRETLPPRWVQIATVIFTAFAIWLTNQMIGGWIFPPLIGIALGAGMFELLSRLSDRMTRGPRRRPH